MGEFWTVTNDRTRDEFLAHASKLCEENQRVTFEYFTKFDNRKQAQNRLAHKWYQEVADQGGEYTPQEVKCRAKHHFAVPILVVDDPVFAAAWEKAIQSFPTYESQCDELLVFFPATSLMTVKQMTRFLTMFQSKMSRKYKLTDPKVYGLDS